MIVLLGMIFSVAHAERGFRAGPCLSDMATECVFAGVTAEYGVESFSVGGSVSFLIPTAMLTAKGYLSKGRFRPFVGGNVGYYAGPGLLGLVYGPSLGIDFDIWKLVLRTQVAYMIDGHSGTMNSLTLNTPLSIGGSVLWKY